jgi:alpha-2-macroglobulin-like protein
MLQKPATRRTFVTGMLYVGAGAVCRIVAGDDVQMNGTGVKLGVVDSRSLGGTERYLTFITTDKPIYRAGETLYVRAVTLHHATHKPLPDAPAIHSVIHIIGPKGDEVASGTIAVQEGVLGFSWLVPDEQAGGEYTAKITFPQHGHTPAERKFEIRAYRAPRLKTQIKFLRDGYGPSDEVVATWHVERAEGGVPAGSKLTVAARVDDGETFRGPATIDHEGNGTARFRLPPVIARGEGSLAIIVDDGGAVETAVKTIPILLQTLDLSMYPEGGELIAGLLNRVYVEAFTPARKPADLAAVVVDLAGGEVARFRSEHEGRGRFEFTPKENHQYKLKITEPAGIQTLFPLPPVKAEGAVIRAERDMFRKHQPVRVGIASTTKDVVVTLARREVLLSRQVPALGDGRQATVTFEVPDSADGVLTVTIWEAGGRPLAERLVFRQPAKSVRVIMSPDTKTCSPGAKTRLSLQTTDERGVPTSAVVGLTVTDDTVLEMIDKREQPARLPVMVFLESEVRELADAHIYLDPNNDKSELAVDLLLGTQGWRRFALVDWKKFVGRHQDGARRALALLEPSLPSLAFSHGMRGFAGVPAPLVLSAKADDFSVAGPSAAIRVGELPPRKAGRIEVKEKEAAPAAAPGPPFARALSALRDTAKPNDFVYTRIYAHELRPDRQPGDRVDFRETLFWHAGLKTSEQGAATVEFSLNDSVTTFRVFADAFTAAGAIGSGTTSFESVNPFYLEPKLPLEVTQGDRILLPVACVNNTSSSLGRVKMTVDTDFSAISPSLDQTLTLAAATRRRTLVELQAGPHNGPFDVKIAATAGAFSDRVVRRITVRPGGFPVEIAAGGLLDRGGVARHSIVIPRDMVAGSFESKIDVYPSPLASMTEALQALIREPCGCFEQTSSTVYPLVMAQQYFLSHQGVPVSLLDQSAEILNRGYDRLRGFECQSGGFEWFGADPGHDALSAYGLMEFTDMSRVRHVDPALLKRTRAWLLAQRDGHGTFARRTQTLHVWLAEPEVATAYNVWALLSAGVDAELATEVKWIRKAAERTENTYVLALAANVLRLAGDGALALLDRLAGKQTENGSLQGATVSVIGSTGEALSIETTAIAVLAWLQNPGFKANVEKAIRYLAEQCKAGRFGTTQSTILALKAIIAYDHSRAVPRAPGQLDLVIDGRPLGSPVKFDEQTRGVIPLPNLPVLSAGNHTVEIRMTGGSQMPYSLAARFSRLKPESSDACRLHLEVSLTNPGPSEGSVTEARVVIVNRSNEIVPTPTAIIGLPGGLEVRHDQLKELVKAKTIAAYEVLGREVVLYWRALAAEARVALPLSLVAAIPGTYTGPASRAYLYYTNEHKHWTDGLRVEIEPIAGERGS